MAITSENNSKPVMHRYTSSQIRYSLVYVLVTFVVLIFLNIYTTSVSRDLFFRTKETSVMDKCLIAGGEIEELEVINTATVSAAMDQLSTLNVSRLMVTDQSGYVIYDSAGTATGTFALFPEIVRAMAGKDVALSQYNDGHLYASAAVPLMSGGHILGCVYVAESDHALGSLLKTLQSTIFQITMILEIMVILFSLAFSNSISRRLRKIMTSMRIIQQGDYSHKVRLGGHDELTFLADEINDLTDRLQISEQKRSRFVSDASHELKTPLASIKLLTDSILQNDMDLDTVREFVCDIGDEAERLNRTTAKLLSLTKVDGRLEDTSEIIMLAPTIRRVVRMLSANAGEQEIDLQFHLEQDCPVLITEDDLYQIVFNLVENGIKYNLPGGKLTVTLSRMDDNAVIKVRDTGVGIPEDALAHIFERFYRVDKARSRATGGSGLGLAIVRAIVLRNRGEITVDTVMDQGSVFTVTFPIFDTEEDAI